MKRPTLRLILITGVLCFWGGTGVVFAADPASPAPKVSVPDAAPASVPAETVIKAVPPSSSVSQNDTISLDFKDADIGSVLRVLSMKSNVNIVTGPEVKGLVTVRLDNVPWEKALDVVLKTYDYVYEREGNIIRVTTRDKMKLEPVETKTFVLNYSKATEIQSAIQDILTERGRIKVAERTNMLVVTDIPTNLYRIGEVIKKLDKETSQAFIDSKVVRTEAGVIENMGIEWNPVVKVTGSSRPTTFPFAQTSQSNLPASLQQFFPVTTAATGVNPNDARNFPTIIPALTTPAPSFNYGTLDFSSFSATLNFLKKASNTKVMSNPRIVVLNNQTAHIQVGDQIPLPTYERNEQTGSMVISGFTYRDTGVVLNVTPHINSSDEILVNLKPEVSSKNGEQTFGAGMAAVSAPIFNVTQAETQLLIHSGQTIAIGGLLTDNAVQTETKVPYLADIPLVGKLFRSKRQGTAGAIGPENSKVETLFFVTVTTVDSQGQPVGARFDGKNDQSRDDQAQQKTAATGAAPGLQNSEKQKVSDNANKDKPA